MNQQNSIFLSETTPDDSDVAEGPVSELQAPVDGKKSTGGHITATPLQAIRRKCIDCSGGCKKYIRYCPCDGIHSSRCEHWPYRFGLRPETASKRHGEQFVTPEMMPESDVNLEDIDRKE